MKVMVLGDTHGNTHWARKMVAKAKKLEVTKIIQCGDFGLWDHHEDGFPFLDAVNKECSDSGVKLYWLDGNHENHDRLEWYRKNNPKTSNGHVYIRSHILYSPRGNRWMWDEKWFMTVGGAVSIDKSGRIPGKSWWAGEQLTDAQLYGIEKAGNQADYLFTHDCSNKTPFRLRLKADIDSQIHRQKIDRVARVVQPKLWFHGHMHTKYDWMVPLDDHAVNWAQVYGLEMDGDFWSWGILDTETDEFTWGPHYDPKVANPSRQQL